MKQTLETKSTHMKYHDSRSLLKTLNSPMKLERNPALVKRSTIRTWKVKKKENNTIMSQGLC